MLRAPPRSTRTYTLFPAATASDLLSAFKTMLLIEEIYGTELRRPVFVSSLHDGIVKLVNSDLRRDVHEAVESKWWNEYDRSGKCPIRVGRLRSYFSPVLRWEERRVGKEFVSTCRSGWRRYH